jgi:tRNA pseudouridine13 synthase
MPLMDLPPLTADFPGIGGTIKQRAEDFFVQEIPLYEPSGAGEHVYCEIEKIGLTTFDAVNRIAGALGVPSREIGYAGLKDARAVTRQVLSIWGTTEPAVMGLQLPGITVRWAARHGNKLRLGHLAANRFAVKVRDVNPTDVVKLKGPLDVIRQRGLPNYFGEQRFGRRGDNDRLGAALASDDNVGVLTLLLGKPDPSVDDPDTVKAREAFDRRDNEASMRHWPRRSGMERRVLARLMKTGKPSQAVRAIDERLRRLWVSALQSRLFNEVVARRVAGGTLDRLMDGDLAWKHDSGGVFRVEESRAAVEQPRCDAFEISPSGPLIGYRMTMPAGEPLRIEQEAFAAAGLEPGDFRGHAIGKVKGARRPLRVRPEDVDLSGGVDDHGGYIAVAFTLPAGSFATVLLQELMKTTPPSTGQAPAEAPEETAAEPDAEPASHETP